MSELRLFGELTLHGCHHDITALAVAILDSCNMLVKIVHVDELGDDQLCLGGSLKGSCLSKEIVLSKDLAVGADPAETVAGSQDLGEGAEEDYEALGVHALECGQVLALEAKLAVGVVLDDGDLVLVDDLHELLTTLHGPSAAGRILEVGDNIDHLDGLIGCKNLLELFHDHAVAVGGDSNEVGLAGLECVKCAEVGRALDDDGVAGVNENTGRVVKTLL